MAITAFSTGINVFFLKGYIHFTISCGYFFDYADDQDEPYLLGVMAA